MLQGWAGYSVVALIVLVMIFVALAIRERLQEHRSFSSYFKAFAPTLATHRGYGKHGPIAENTIPAFLAAEKIGFQAHELDVRRSMDGEIILLHGPTLDQTTDGTGRLEEMTSAQLEKLDAAHYLRKTKASTSEKKVALPRLADVLRAIAPGTRINIEIKRDRWDFSRGLEELTLATVQAEKAGARVCFSGFHFLTLWRLRNLQTQIPVGLLIEPGFAARFKLWLYRLILLPDNIHLHYSTATPRLMHYLKRLGYGLAFWTVNDLETAQSLFNEGADFVITDNISLIENFPPKKSRTTTP
jgi:glycerophosphoryl diester phosphodiesterase